MFFGRESAFQGEPDHSKNKTRRFLGRFGIHSYQESETTSLPKGVIVFPTIKNRGQNITDTPVEQIGLLCHENQVPVVQIGETGTIPSAVEIVRQLFETPQAA